MTLSGKNMAVVLPGVSELRFENTGVSGRALSTDSSETSAVAHA